jgi:hypothetical protein
MGKFFIQGNGRQPAFVFHRCYQTAPHAAAHEGGNHGEFLKSVADAKAKNTSYASGDPQRYMLMLSRLNGMGGRNSPP